MCGHFHHQIPYLLTFHWPWGMKFQGFVSWSLASDHEWWYPTTTTCQSLQRISPNFSATIAHSLTTHRQRIIESFELKGTLKSHLVQFPCRNRDRGWRRSYSSYQPPWCAESEEKAHFTLPGMEEKISKWISRLKSAEATTPKTTRKTWRQNEINYVP